MSTLISWTDETWNPTTGCSRVSDGCRFCYAESLSLRFGWSQKPWTAGNAAENVVLHPDRLRKPYAWKKPCRVFVNSMSDLFHELIPFAFIDDVFAVMRDTPRHTYQVLTKRPEVARAYSASLAERGLDWPANVWMGTSVELARHLDRVEILRAVPCAVRFLSCEPLLGPLVPGLDLAGIHWVIVGGESGLHMKKHPERHMQQGWARDIRTQCRRQGAAFFFKQSSGIRPGMGTALVEEDGSAHEWHEYPLGDLAAAV